MTKRKEKFVYFSVTMDMCSMKHKGYSVCFKIVLINDIVIVVTNDKNIYLVSSLSKELKIY
jgi:hypothetical protein